MEVVLVAALAASLGFFLGLVVGARRAINLFMSGRALRTTNAALGFMPDTMPTRSASDILSGRIRIWLGATEYDLPVLPRAQSRRWLEGINARFALLASHIESSGDDAPAILGMLITEVDAMYDSLLAYDQAGLLPSREEADETATEAQILHAFVEVWRAVHPFVATLLDQSGGSPTGGISLEQLSSAPPSTAGVPATSRTS